MSYFDVIIVGGGAAGLMCAGVAGALGKSVLVIEHANKVGKKILMSGGGRCNFTNYYIEPSNYISQNPHFCKSALSRCTQYDFLDLVHQHKIPYHEKTLGQLFCDNKSKDILNLLLAECKKSQVEIRTLCEIDNVQNIDSNSGDSEQTRRFIISSTQGQFESRSLVVATGGLSIPTMGASGWGYQLAKQHKIKLTLRVPSLVPFVFKETLGALFSDLSGVAVDVEITSGNHSFKEALLFTHRGISGPAVLQISNYWNFGDLISINFMPNNSLPELIARWRDEGRQSALKNLLSEYFSKRFVEAWLNFLDSSGALVNKTVNQLSKQEILELEKAFQYFECVPHDTEGYRTAEVTRGGVDTNEVSSKTFESKKVPGLFFVGEVLDVTGWLGGYNFQWAWSSGYCAAQYV